MKIGLFVLYIAFMLIYFAFTYYSTSSTVALLLGGLSIVMIILSIYIMAKNNKKMKDALFNVFGAIMWWTR